MTKTTEPEFMAGDLVEAVKGPRVVRDIVHLGAGPIFGGSLYLGVPSLFGPSQINSYIELGYTLTRLDRPKPPVVLPTTEGTVILWNANDTHGERAAVRRAHSNPGWHYQGASKRNGNIRSSHEYTSAEILKEIGSAKFTVLRPDAEVAAETARKMRDVILAEFVEGLGIRSYRHDVHTAARKFGVTS